ncbi:MAG TPA: hypothetical protein VK776_24565, partial [Bryobacteraceae bacterium]|nr:hypothetical protein [Bryobacteraceae bacterium]
MGEGQRQELEDGEFPGHSAPSRARRPLRTLNGPAGELRDGVYHHNASGVELTLPAGWTVGQPPPAQDDPNYAITLLDPEHRARS